MNEFSKAVLKRLAISSIGTLAGLMAFVLSSVYQVTFYSCVASLVTLLIFIIIASIRRRFPGFLISSFVIVAGLLSLLIVWAKLTSGVESYREVYLQSKRLGNSRIIINRMDEVLDTHKIFYGAKSVEKTFQRDSIVYIDEFEYVFGALCLESIEEAGKVIAFSRDTARIYLPWKGHKVFCDEFLGSKLTRILDQDTLAFYSNAIYSTKTLPKNHIKVSLIHMGDALYSVVDTGKIVKSNELQ